uniref:sorting and assembly machinery component 50 homolog A-like n=1 Tax=Styela clava TaxID=7725 RepID=UPI00193A4CB7|nr:sorting and assembly machinery component 50 homolog A-like [Styela clava]
MVLMAKESSAIREVTEDSPASKKEETVVFKDKKCVVQKVQISGLKKTKSDFVLPELEQVMQSSTFVTAYQSALDCKKKLLNLGIFDHVDIIMDTTSHYKGNKVPNGIQILFRVKEKRSLTGEARTEMSNNDQPQWVIRLMSPNVFGRGEMLSATFSRKLGSESVSGNGFYSPHDFSFAASKPFKNGSLFRMSILQDRQDCPWNSTSLTVRGGQLEYQFPLFNNTHTLAYHAHWRDLASSNNTTAFPIRENFGHTAKSSLLHSVTMDRTDDKILPSKGYMIKMTEELAGVGIGSKYIKENMELQFHKTLFRRLTLSAGFRGGFIVPFDNEQTQIPDRFFIGGPLTLRGFDMNRAGPQVDGDFLGGNCYWVAGLHAYLPLPFYWRNFGKGSWLDGFRIHGFFNAGNVLTFDNNQMIRNQLSCLAENIRTSYGVGLVYNFMRGARIELNFCVPSSVVAGDKVCDGVQFGIGLSTV